MLGACENMFLKMRVVYILTQKYPSHQLDCSVIIQETIIWNGTRVIHHSFIDFTCEISKKWYPIRCVCFANKLKKKFDFCVMYMSISITLNLEK